MNYNYIIVALIMIGFDIVTGWMKAISLGNFKSSKMRQGLLSKVGEMLILFLMYIFEHFMPLLGVDFGLPVVAIVGTYIIVMELSSIIENIGVINPGLSNKLSHVFAEFIKTEIDDKEEEE